MKEIIFLSKSKKELTSIDDRRARAGMLLFISLEAMEIERGTEIDDVETLIERACKVVGVDHSGCKKKALHFNEGGAKAFEGKCSRVYRLVYSLSFVGKVCILHCFKKHRDDYEKTTITTVASRLKDARQTCSNPRGSPMKIATNTDRNTYGDLDSLYGDFGFVGQNVERKIHCWIELVKAIADSALEARALEERLELDADGLGSLMAGDFDRFTVEQIQAYIGRLVGPEDTSHWLHLTASLIRELRVWLDQRLADVFPPVDHVAPAYRGGSRAHPPAVQSKDLQATTPREPPTLQGLDDPRFGWLPTLVKQEEEGVSLVLQRRDGAGTADEAPPQVSVFIDGESAVVRSLDYIAQTGRLELLLDGKLPTPDFDVAVSPSQGGELVLHLRMV